MRSKEINRKKPIFSCELKATEEKGRICIHNLNVKIRGFRSGTILKCYGSGTLIRRYDQNKYRNPITTNNMDRNSLNLKVYGQNSHGKRILKPCRSEFKTQTVELCTVSYRPEPSNEYKIST